MDNNPFTVFGCPPVLALDGKLDKARVARLLAKNHVSVVGRRYFGKTVFARDLCTCSPKGNGEITGSIYWDLGHKTPLDDADFYAQFAPFFQGAPEGSPRRPTDLLPPTIISMKKSTMCWNTSRD